MKSKEIAECLDGIGAKLFGMTLTEAHEKGVCIDCKEEAMGKCYSEAGRKEYGISGLCEACFDAMFARDDARDKDDEEDDEWADEEAAY
jgi:hypothetical protein